MRRFVLAAGLAAIIACTSGSNSPSTTPTNAPSDFQNFTCNDFTNPDDIPPSFRDMQLKFIEDHQTFEGFSDADRNYANRVERGTKLVAGNAYRDDNLNGDIYGLNMLIVHLPTGNSIGVSTYVGIINALCRDADGYPYVLLNEPDDLLAEKITNYSFKSNPVQGAVQLKISQRNLLPIREKSIPKEPIKISELIDSIHKIPDGDYAAKFDEVPSWDFEVGGVLFRLESGLAYSGHPLLSYQGDSDPAHYVVVTVPFSVDASSEHNRSIFDSGPNSVKVHQAGF